LSCYPGVRGVAVIDVPDDMDSGVLKAFVVPQEGACVDTTELLDWMRPQLKDCKLPHIIEFCSSLPVTGTGKVARHLLSRLKHSRNSAHVQTARHAKPLDPVLPVIVR
jgi:acyl-coenzyme A synthetase/AMP-(fatty) acid ligase